MSRDHSYIKGHVRSSYNCLSMQTKNKKNNCCVICTFRESLFLHSTNFYFNFSPRAAEDLAMRLGHDTKY